MTLPRFTPFQSLLDLSRGRVRESGAATRAMIVAGLLAALSAGVSPVSAADPSDTKPTPSPHAEEEFTRESMDALGRPETTPAPGGPIVSQRVAATRVKSPQLARSQVDSKDFPARSRDSVVAVHHARSHASPKREKPRIVISKSQSSRRSPVVSFVYWWNGFVIRTFHTKSGTVMLSRYGAKT